MQTLIAASLARALQCHPGEPAVVGAESVTYLQLYERTARLASAIAESYSRSARIGLLSLNSVEHLEAWYAVPSCGAVLTDLNYRLAPDELAFVIDDAGCEAMLVDDAHLALGIELKGRCRTLRDIIHFGSRSHEEAVPYEQFLASGSAIALETAADEDRLAGIFYTGGTTGAAKGVMLSHGNLVSNAKHVLASLPYDSRSRYLHAAPMFHLADGSQTIAATWVGASHAIVARFEPGDVIRAIREMRVSHTLLVPTMINMLVQHLIAHSDHLTELEVLMYGASPMPTALLREAMERLTASWYQLYGMTEAAPLVTTLTDRDHKHGAAETTLEHRLLSAGRPVPGVEVSIADEFGGAVGAGTSGEIVVRGPNVMSGYWKRQEETSAAFLPGGWYRTGDAGYQDEDGYLFVVDRVKDVIITGGENVYSAEVERALHGHPDVLEAAIIGIPSAQWGEAVHAIVVLKADARADEKELLDRCRRSLAGYKVPRSLEMRAEALPKSGAGKVLKRDLRAPHWEGVAE